VASTPLAAESVVRARSRLVAAALEWITPGLGMMYIGNFWLGALVLVGTLFTTVMLIGVALANATQVSLADAVNFLGWLLLLHSFWLLTRTLWAWKLAAGLPWLSKVRGVVNA